MASITRADVATIIQEEYAPTFLKEAEVQSAVLNAFPTVNMGTKVANMPVIATRPHAKWVGETAGGDAVKPTSKATWGNKTLTAEELAVIVPIHENTVDDATEDMLDQIAKLGAAAIAMALDAAVVFGFNKPVSWTSPDLLKAAIDAGNTVVYSANPGVDDLAGSILQAAGQVADDMYDPTTVFTKSGIRYRMANLRDANGAPIFVANMSQATVTGGASVGNLLGLDAYGLRGTVMDWTAPAEKPTWDPNTTGTQAVIADRDRVIIGIRQDITVKFLDQATVGGINLAEEDHVALRFKARFAYVLGDRTGASPTAAVGDGGPTAP